MYNAGCPTTRFLVHVSEPMLPSVAESLPKMLKDEIQNVHYLESFMRSDSEVKGITQTRTVASHGAKHS